MSALHMNKEDQAIYMAPLHFRLTRKNHQGRKKKLSRSTPIINAGREKEIHHKL